MDNTKSQQLGVPEWLLENENYIPRMDKDTFVDKSILSVFKVISRIKMQDSIKKARVNLNVSLHVLCTAILLILVSLTKSFIFVIIVNVYLLSILSMTDIDKLVKILKMSFGVTLFTAVIMLPAFFMGNSYSSIMITTKVFASITAMGLLSHATRWSSLTEALKRFHVPDIFILILDITIKYIYMLGEMSLNMLYALKLRSVGKNNKKYTALGGIAGTIFLQSKEMAEGMYQAMECRGFSGEYHINSKSKFGWIDYTYILINIGFVMLYLYLGKML